MRTVKLSILSVLALSCSVWACSSEDDEVVTPKAPVVTVTGGAGGSSGGAGGQASGGAPSGGASSGGSGGLPVSTGGGGTTSTGGKTSTAECSSLKQKDKTATLPFALDDFFIPSGFMPAAEAEAKTITMAEGCAGSTGVCHTNTFAPKVADGAEAVMAWGGVYWMNAEQNWGTAPGAPVAPGAKKITFRAWADADGIPGAGETLPVTFFAGGILGDAASDEFKAEAKVNLTKTPQTFEIPIEAGTEYSCVIGGFGWSVGDVLQGTSVKFYVDAVTWE